MQVLYLPLPTNLVNSVLTRKMLLEKLTIKEGLLCTKGQLEKS